MAERVYLDWNASAPLRPQARAAMVAALNHAGNPSSVHREGRAARRLVEEAREKVATLVGADPSRVVFTSGGTEANMLALSPTARYGWLLVSAIEHPSVRGGGRFAADRVGEIPVTAAGQVDLVALERQLGDAARAGRGSVLVSIMLANNESGVIQPIEQAAKIIHAAGGVLHVDAIQGAGRVPCNIEQLEADLLSLSAHKLGGPKGVGALIRGSSTIELDPLIRGGGQERRLRAGSENVAGIAGFGAAAEVASTGLEAEWARVDRLRNRLEAGLREASPDAIVFGAGRNRLPNTTLFASPGVKAETAVIALDLEGIAVSSGAACSSGKVQPSHVLAAMGIPLEFARGGIRVSLGWETTESEVECFLAAWLKFCGALHKLQGEVAA
jgi:cysteine desulfurase